jgi:hypothetical protein
MMVLLFTILILELAKSRGHKFSKKANLILKNWFYKHYSYPYPSKEDINELATTCSLTPK